jgi:hypothetical protein
VLTALFTVALTVPDTAGVADCVGAAFNAALVIAPITAVGLPLRALLIRAFCVAALLNELVKVFVVAVVVLVDGTPSLAVPVKALAAPPNMAALSAAVIPLPSTGLVPPMLIGLPVRSVTITIHFDDFKVYGDELREQITNGFYTTYDFHFGITKFSSFKSSNIL